MKYRILSLLALAGVLFSGCVKEKLTAEGGSILAVMENDDTRTSVTDEGKFTWSEGDQVWLHTTSGSVVGTLSSGAGTSSAEFSFGAYFGEMTGKAVYPYNEGHSVSGDVLSVAMPSSYDLGSNLTNTNAAMYGELSDDRLKFNHMAGVMRFKFKNVPAGVNKFTITLDKKISGTFSADLTEAYPVIEAVETSVASEKTITLNFNALTETSELSLYVPLPLGTYNSLDLALYAGSQSVWTYSKSVTNTISRKSLKLMPAVTLGGTIGGDIEGGESGEEPDPDVPTNGDLSAVESANSYIVSEGGAYKFSTVKGNSSESVGAVASAEVLWESFGTDVTPSVVDLIKTTSYKDGEIIFQTADPFKEGNALIAAKDASGTILWSWHIWFTDLPEEQVYYNNAGTMMDRNLGATSASPDGDCVYGLFYQWGRKDPFLGNSATLCPNAVASNAIYGTIEYATANPTTFITSYNTNNEDWYYTGPSPIDNTRWTESSSPKAIYDPCPPGWRVPDGGDNGVWSTALGSPSSFEDQTLYNGYDSGSNLSGKFGSDQSIWYSAPGFLWYADATMNVIGGLGFYWSASPNNKRAYCLNLGYGCFSPSASDSRANGYSVRCIKEGSFSSKPSEPEQPEVSIVDQSANCYIVSEAGTYTFAAVKGNSSESVGEVASAEVLWETFGIDVTPNVGDLVKSVSCSEGQITFQTADPFKEGNAVIAAKDAYGTILWSWHIWLTDEPQEQVYYNNAGTMMDRNLGATSATHGDVRALGLLYQWGRKDPFLGSSSISVGVEAKSTIDWPSTIELNSITSAGITAYATANPTTFITNSDYFIDNYDETGWTRSKYKKSIDDPCPAGWRVPDGSLDCFWLKAAGLTYFSGYPYDTTNKGMNFSGQFGSLSTIWYPASGNRSNADGSLYGVGNSGYYWSASEEGGNIAYVLDFSSEGEVRTTWDAYNRGAGLSVRCVLESSLNQPAPEPIYVNISAEGTANSYIVSKRGSYKFSTVKGNSRESVGEVASAEVLWESFGTNTSPAVGALIETTSYKDGEIYFQTADTFKEGNAVIAAKDAEGNILWSWHIWLTDQPEGQVYYNNAGTMMDRNLGATSATPGDVGALGLLYQWGRKDPFLGSYSISSNSIAKSTITWPSSVMSVLSSEGKVIVNGTIEYAIANPTTFIKANSSNNDWYYSGSSSTDNTRWTTSTKAKSIYDPCPSGWRVPNGGSTGVWSKALGLSAPFTESSLYDSAKEGMNFSCKFGSDQTIWYPASGCRYYSDGSLDNVGGFGFYWSASPGSNLAYFLYFSSNGYVDPSNFSSRAYGYSVRCVRESE